MRVGRWAMLAIAVLGFFLVVTAYAVYLALFSGPNPVIYHVEVTDVKAPPPPPSLVLTDDDPSTHHPEFDPALVDSRPLGDWQVNSSGAVIAIDCPMIRGDYEGHLLKLYPSYAEAMAGVQAGDRQVLPSANLIDGVAKQIDDGLFAAIERAMLVGDAGDLPSVGPWIQRMFDKSSADAATQAYLQAALELSGVEPTTDPALRRATDEWLARFQKTPMSQPAGFYTWNDELKRAWRTFRFLQTPLIGDDLEPVARGLAAILAADASLASDYAAIHGFYSLLSNPASSLNLSALIGRESDELKVIAEAAGLKPAVTVLPTSTSRETELFNSMFPMGLPANVDLMSELINRIRKGEVDLTPKPGEGWYQHQVHALQTLLVTDELQESDKLLLSANYKRRLVEAFKAMITKRRETHMRSMETASPMSAAPLQDSEVTPRLRLEPAATYYLRTARAYRFVETLLDANLGAAALDRMHGLTATGERNLSLREELAAIVNRNYGFYLVVCEDLGMSPELADDELADLESAKGAAIEWLENFASDPDLAVDTRVVAPIYVDPFKGSMRLWGTIGVRMAKLTVRYEIGPQVRPADGSADWTMAERYQLGTVDLLIPVDEFVEFEKAGIQVPTREEFRALCSKYENKEAFLVGESR